MDRDRFESTLRVAAEAALKFAREFVSQSLPETIAFVIYPNQSYDGNPLEGEDGNRTFVKLDCCGRFTSDEDRLYHRNSGVPPFSIKSPPIPPGWVSVQMSGPFDLHWSESRRGGV